MRLRDAREIRRLESRLWRYGAILANLYMREEDEWGRLHVTAAAYVLRVERNKLSLVKHSLTKLAQQNHLTIMF